MVEPPAEERDSTDLRLDALAYKMMGSLLLVAGGLLLGTLVAVRRFNPVIRDGVRAYAVPGTDGRHVLDATALTVLASSGGVLFALGLVGFMLARAKVRRPVGLSRMPQADPSPRPLWRSVLILVVGLVVLAGVVYARRS
ncbi:hypothetical protein [Lichenifustis flavocetrariae]|uniref:Uncharacterized protein n=1 Tax=Lichenifustis flavocetrariae TaxID=2949735 RepID=A0AA42CJK1_9HYPH|nr:hypothetical protein [Lichenifustis flavocetrariae]MCW6509544.1 hypothetical protein [Lichenifustis flavocetrariae]